jgi:hypothetical protein
MLTNQTIFTEFFAKNGLGTMLKNLLTLYNTKKKGERTTTKFSSWLQAKQPVRLWRMKTLLNGIFGSGAGHESMILV